MDNPNSTNNNNNNKDSPERPLTGLNLVLMTLGLGLGTFIQILDISIANVSIPNIAGNLGVSPSQGTWVITSFAVSNAIVLPLTGWLSIRFGQVRLFVWATALFSIFSLVCGLSWTFPMLLFARTIQGAVAGALVPLSQSLILVHYPPEKRGFAMGIWAMIVMVAPVTGPVLGGWITDNYGWSWIFYINLPIGIVSSILTWNTLYNRESEKHKYPVDYIGFILLVICVGSVQILLDTGHDLDWFGSNTIIALAIISFIAFAFFIVWNKYSEYPLIDFSFFKYRTFVLSIFISAIGFGLYFGNVVLFPLWLQTSMGYTALWAGLSLAPVGILSLFMAPLIGKYLHLLDLRYWIFISLLLFAFSFFLFSDFNTQVSFIQLTIPRYILGAAVSFFFVPLTVLSLSEIPRGIAYASASGIFTFIRILIGSGFGTAINVNIWEDRIIAHHSNISQNLMTFPYAVNQTTQVLRERGLEPDVITGIINQLTDQQAAILALNDWFRMATFGFLLLIPLVWFCRPKIVYEGIKQSVFME